MLGFVISGGLAFITDVGIAKAAHVYLGLSWPVSRLLAIAGAMVVAWAAHRTLTFAVNLPPTLREFGRYVGVAWSTAVLNYLLFLGVLWLAPGLDGTIAIGISSLFAMAYSYAGMRFGVFNRKP
jgi:putative flippase GtrA